MQKTYSKRKKYLVQRNIQGNLAVRCTIYWFFCLCTIFLFVAIATAYSGKLQPAGELFGGIWKQYSPAVLASVFLLPLIVWDLIKSSHRIVGPLIRLENEMKRLANGEEVRELKFRPTDHWVGLADQFNRIAVVQKQLREQAGSSSTSKSSEYETVGYSD